jgi:hypothetical protein
VTRPATVRAAILRLLPPYSARRWAFPRTLQRRDPFLRDRHMHANLAQLMRDGYAVRRVDEETGMWVYAKAKRKNGADR